MSKAEVKMAEQEVKQSEIKLDRAMDHLEEKVARTVDTINKPKRMMRNFQRIARQTYGDTRVLASQYADDVRAAVVPVLRKSQTSARSCYYQARSNPRLLLGLGGLILGSVAGYYLWKSYRNRSLIKTELVPVIIEEDILVLTDRSSI